MDNSALLESEAKKRWCPHARIPLYGTSPTDEEGPAGANRPPPSLTAGNTRMVVEAVAAATRCIGSDCMAWRWHRGVTGEPFGYCGLAGPAR